MAPTIKASNEWHLLRRQLALVDYKTKHRCLFVPHSSGFTSLLFSNSPPLTLDTLIWHAQISEWQLFVRPSSHCLASLPTNFPDIKPTCILQAPSELQFVVEDSLDRLNHHHHHHQSRRNHHSSAQILQFSSQFRRASPSLFRTLIATMSPATSEKEKTFIQNQWTEKIGWRSVQGDRISGASTSPTNANAARQLPAAPIKTALIPMFRLIAGLLASVFGLLLALGQTPQVQAVSKRFLKGFIMGAYFAKHHKP